MEHVTLHEYCEEAQSFIQAGETDKAIRIIRHILRHYPQHVPSYRLLGQALLVAGNYDEADQQFRRVLSADPEDVASRVGLAQICETRGSLDKAIWQMQRAQELSPADADLRAQLGRLMGVQQGDGAPQPTDLTRAALGRIHASNGLYDKAVQELRAVLAENPGRVEVETTLAEVLWRSGQTLEAGELGRRILNKLPHALKANLIVGALWVNGGRRDAAQPYLELAQALDPENSVARSLFGEQSPLPPRPVTIERLAEEKLEGVELKPPAPPAESVPVVQKLETETDWRSILHEKEAAPMSDEERPEEGFDLPEWLKGVGDELLEEEEQPAATTASEGEAAEDETPGWLRRLVKRTKEAGRAGEAPPAEPAAQPDWLEELRPTVAEETPAEAGQPDWLQAIMAGGPVEEPELTSPPTVEEPEEEAAVPEATVTAGEDEGRSLWERILAEEGLDLGGVEEAPPPEAAGMTAEEWLRSTSDLERAPAQPAAEQPSVEEEVQAPTEPIAEREAPELELPDWLRELQETETLEEPALDEAAMATPTEERTPSFLEPMEAAVEESEVPEWLREIMASETAPDEEAPVPAAEIPPYAAAPVDEASLPDWLRDLKEPAAEEQAEAPPPAPAVPELTATADEGRSLWERILAEEGLDLGGVEEAPPPEAAGMTAEEWLRSTSDLERAPAQPAAEQPSVEEEVQAPTEPIAEREAPELELPDWLQDFRESAEEPTAGSEVGVQEEPAAPEVGLPDWLRQVAAGEPITPQESTAETAEEPFELPDWLREQQELEEEAELAAPPELASLPDEAAQAVEAEVDEAGLPDWLREPSLVGGEPIEEEARPSAEMPDWLTELESEQMLLEEEEEFEEPIELETGEMPEWLGEIMAGEPPLAEGWGLEPETAESAEATEREMPAWLHDLHRREEEAPTEPAAAVEEPEVAPEAPEEVGPARGPELPDWLLRLREGVSETEPVPPELAHVEEEAFPAEELTVEWEEIQPEASEPDWLGELVRAEESVAEFETSEAEELLDLAPQLYSPVTEAEAEAPPAPPEPEPMEAITPPPARPVEVPTTRQLHELRAEDLPKDPAARLAMARAALNADDWSDALLIYQSLVNSSELLDNVIDNLKVGLRRHPDDASGYELLGDACMKDGRLAEALQSYRAALTKL